MGYFVKEYLYMKEGIDHSTAQKLVVNVEGPVEDLVRKDSKFKKLGLDPSAFVDNPRAVADILEKHPALLQRPVLMRGDRVVVGRPRDRTVEFLSE